MIQIMNQFNYCKNLFRYSKELFCYLKNQYLGPKVNTDTYTKSFQDT